MRKKGPLTDLQAAKVVAHDAMMVTIAPYVRRGRALELLSDNALRDRWIADFKTWVIEPDDLSKQRAVDDSSAELELRNLPLPEEAVEDALALIERKIGAAQKAIRSGFGATERLRTGAKRISGRQANGKATRSGPKGG